MKNYDVIVIGGGFLGLSTAYQLSKKGVRTLVLEARDIGSGTSGACAGRAQTCEGHLDPLNTTLIREGIKRHEALEEELGFDYEWRREGLILIISTQEMWDNWNHRSAVLTPAGIPTEVLDVQALQKLEPRMNTAGLLGAAYSVEGMLNPLKFTRAYARAAQRCGTVIQGDSAVVEMQVENRRVTAVKTATETYSAAVVAVMAGAWEPVVTRMAGVEVPIRHTQAEALVTEPIPEIIYNNVEIADFYQTIHGKPRAVAVGVHPQPNGTLVITESVTRTDELHQRVSAWGLSSLAGELARLYPCLNHVRVLRSWARPTSFTPDEEPLIGWLTQLENVFVASSMVETITTIPVISEWMGMMISGETPEFSMEKYSPARFDQ